MTSQDGEGVRVLDWLNSTVVTVAGVPTTWAELLGFLTGVVNVWLVARQRVWNWPVGIVNVVLLMLLFWTAGLYADAGTLSDTPL
jgi:nicotinamide mononucleotide transporter